VRLRRKFFAVACLCLWPLVATWGAKLLVVRRPLQHADVVLVLSGSSSYKQRVQAAAEIFFQGRADRILITNDNQRGGWSQEKASNPFFYERELDELGRLGVPAERIEVLPQAVSSTYEEAILLRAYIDSHFVKSALIVTSPYHSRRAIWIVRRVCNNTNVALGIETVPIGVDSPRPAFWWLTPVGWRVVAGEYLKLGYYWLSY
jgi:uncharacterized SAM-binding protein YcdF (DUF218 family)